MRAYTNFPGTPCTYHGKVGLPVEQVSPDELERRRREFHALRTKRVKKARPKALRVLVAPLLLRNASRCQGSTKRCQWLESRENGRRKCGWFGDDLPNGVRCPDCLNSPAPAKDEVE